MTIKMNDKIIRGEEMVKEELIKGVWYDIDWVSGEEPQDTHIQITIEADPDDLGKSLLKVLWSLRGIVKDILKRRR